MSSVGRIEISKQSDKTVRLRIKDTHKHSLSHSIADITNVKYIKEEKNLIWRPSI